MPPPPARRPPATVAAPAPARLSDDRDPPRASRSAARRRRPPPAGSPRPPHVFLPAATVAASNSGVLPHGATNRCSQHQNDGASVLPSHMVDRPSSRGSSTSSSTIGSDFLDVPSYHLPTVASRPLSTETRSGSLQRSLFPDSITNVLKAPLKTVRRQAPTSQGKGFSLRLDDFPVLGSKNSASNSQQGEELQHFIWFARGAEQAQLHGPQAHNTCIPPPWLDYWHPPPDQLLYKLLLYLVLLCSIILVVVI